MADITVADFRAKFGEFNAVSDADVTEYIATAYLLSDVSREATFYTAAHLGSLDAAERSATAIAMADSRGGAIIEETFGPKKLKFLQQAMDSREVWFTSSTYGRLALQLEKRSPSGILSVRSY